MESTILQEIANFDTKAPIHMTICYEDFDETDEIIFKTEKEIVDDINEGEVSDELGRKQHEKYAELLDNTKGLRSNYNIEQSISKICNNDQYENLTKSKQNESRKRKKNQSITNKNKISNKKKNAAKPVPNTYNNENEVKTELPALSIKSGAKSSSTSASAKLKLKLKLGKKSDTESSLPNLSSTSDQLAIKSGTESNLPNLSSTSDQLAIKSDTESNLPNLSSTSDQLAIKSDTESNLPNLSSTSDQLAIKSDTQSSLPNLSSTSVQPNPSNLVGEKDENMKTPTCVMSLSDMRERLEFVAKKIESVLVAFSMHKLHQTQSTNETFNKVKYYFFRLCYDTVARILLPSDKNRFVMKTLLQTTYWRQHYPSYEHSEQDYENVFHELLMWTKFTKEKVAANRTSGERNKPVQSALPAPPNNGVEIDNSDKHSGDKICIFSSGLSGREITINIDANLNNYLDTSNKCKEISGEKPHAIKINQQKTVIPPNNTSNLQSQSEHLAQFLQPKPNTINNHQTLQELLNQPAIRIPFQNNVEANNTQHDFEESIKQIEVHKAVRTQQKQGPPPYSQHPQPYIGKSHQVPPGNRHPSHVQRKCRPPYRPPCTPHHEHVSSDRQKEPPKYDQSIPNQRPMGPSEYDLFRYQQRQQVHREQFQGGQPPCQSLQHGHCQLNQSQCVVQNRNFQVPNPQPLPRLPPYETLQVEQSQCTRISYSSKSQGGPPQCVQIPYGQLQAQYVGTQNSPLQPGYGTSGGQLLGRPQHSEYSIQHGQPQLQLSQPLVPQNDQTYIAPELEKSRATRWYRDPKELYNQKHIQPQIPKSSPRSASTDSGFISPLDFNASADQTAPSSSDQSEECSPFGKISHVTSLNPKVAFIAEGNCVVCNKRTKQVCMGCMQLYYCTYTCQEKDWSSHGPNCIGAIHNTC